MWMRRGPGLCTEGWSPAGGTTEDGLIRDWESGRGDLEVKSSEKEVGHWDVPLRLYVAPDFTWDECLPSTMSSQHEV